MSPIDFSSWQMREIKNEPLSEEELHEMHGLTGSYEALFSKRSTKIKELGIDVKSLEENDFQKLLLRHYSFLKRPVILYNNEIFIGNEKSSVTKLYQTLGIKN